MDNIIKFVKEELKNDHSGHDFKHIERVVNNAKKIMKVDGSNERIVLTACYLHDIIDKKIFNDIESQLNKVITTLQNNNYLEEEIKEIIDIITSISFNGGDFKELSTINSMVVRDADRLDAIGSIGIIRTIQYGTIHNREFYEDDNIKEVDDKYCFNKSTNSTLSHFYDKLLKLESLMLTSEGKRLAKTRTKIMSDFLENFYNELK